MPTPAPSSADIDDWLRALIASGRSEENIFRLATIKFGHVWGDIVAVLIENMANGLMPDVQRSACSCPGNNGGDDFAG